MQDLYPGYYHNVRCLAGACPDTCCAQWEVVVDDETAALYATVPGPLGRRLREAMTIDEAGDRIIRHTEGRCPLLDEGGPVRGAAGPGPRGPVPHLPGISPAVPGLHPVPGA